MRYSLLPDPGRINPGFMLRDRLNGVGDDPSQTEGNPNTASGSSSSSGGGGSSFFPSLGNVFVDLFKTNAPSLINWGITGNPPQTVVTTNPQTGQPSIATIPGGTQTLAKATGSLPTWAVPAMIAAGVAVVFLAMRKK